MLASSSTRHLLRSVQGALLVLSLVAGGCALPLVFEELKSGGQNVCDADGGSCEENPDGGGTNVSADGGTSIPEDGGGGPLCIPGTTDKAPRIESVSPAVVAAGDLLTITGQNFEHASLTVGAGVGPCAVVTATATQITCTTPFDFDASMLGMQLPVQVTTEFGCAEKPKAITYEARPPAITSVEPTTVRYGDKITVYGTNLNRPDAQALFTNAPKVTASFAASDRLEFVVPQGAGSGTVTIELGSDPSLTTPFITVLTVAIMAVETTSAGPLDEVRVVGYGLNPGPQNNPPLVVFIGSTPVDMTADTVRTEGSYMSFFVPLDAVGGPIRVEKGAESDTSREALTIVQRSLVTGNDLDTVIVDGVATHTSPSLAAQFATPGPVTGRILFQSGPSRGWVRSLEAIKSAGTFTTAAPTWGQPVSPSTGQSFTIAQ